MAIDYRLPKLAMSMNEGTINQWLVEDGQQIEKGQAILELETDKVTQEIESPEAGYFHILAQEGETYKVNTLIAKICLSKEELLSLTESGVTNANTGKGIQPNIEQTEIDKKSAFSHSGNHSLSDRVIASPLAKKIALDNQVDLTALTGSGPNGRIIKQDVMAALASSAVEQVSPTNPPGGKVEKMRIPIKGMRQTIAERMQASLQNTAQLSSVWESDITDLLTMRQKIAAQEEQLGTRVSINAFILKAIAYAIHQVPVANACLQGDDLVIYNTINIGIAVSVAGSSDYDNGLLVPVLKDIANKGLVDIDLAMKDLILRARSNTLSPDELTGSTITMTSTAGLAPPGCQSTPILNRPNTVIIGPSTPIEKPAMYEGNITPRTLMPISLTFDHCVLDGDPAMRFAKALHECLESPEPLLA